MEKNTLFVHYWLYKYRNRRCTDRSFFRCLRVKRLISVVGITAKYCKPTDACKFDFPSKHFKVPVFLPVGNRGSVALIATHISLIVGEPLPLRDHYRRKKERTNVGFSLTIPFEV